MSSMLTVEDDSEKRKSTFFIQEFNFIKVLHSWEPYDKKSLIIWKNIKTEKRRVFHKIVLFFLNTQILILNQCRLHIY